MQMLTRAQFAATMPSPDAPHSFQTTRWSMVRRATGEDDAAARSALAALCEAYWFPICAFIRRSGRTPHDAEDLTQGFFAWLLTKGALAKADEDKGRHLPPHLRAAVRERRA